MIEEAAAHASKESFFQTAAKQARRLVRPIKDRYDGMILPLDHFFGLRAYGLVVYGALPASLGALGAFKPPDQATLGSRIGLAALPYICAVALIPVVLTFVLVRQRLANWYLLRDHLFMRAATITLAIIAVSSFVCAANGLLVGTFRLVGISVWWASPFHDKAWPIGICLLLSFVYLVGSSTLFLTVVKEDSDLPLLPGKDEIASIKSLRGCLKGIAMSPLQTEQPETEGPDLTERVTQLTTAIEAAMTLITNLGNSFNRLGRKRFYEELSEELVDLRAAATDVNNVSINWSSYWAPDVDLTSLNEVMKMRRARIESLRRSSQWLIR